MQPLSTTKRLATFVVVILFLGAVPLTTIAQDTASTPGHLDTLQTVPQLLAQATDPGGPPMEERMIVMSAGLTILGGLALLLYLRRREMDREAGILQ